MKIDTDALKKQVILHLPYLLFLLVFAKLGEAVRLAPGADASQKLLGLSEGFSMAFQSMWPGAALDWLVGLCGAVIVRLAVYLKGKDAKKYRKNVEYGSARWGNKTDIAPFMDPKPENNIILTQTEGLMMSGRPKNPAHARNKNVLVVGGSGSGKTRFFIKPNLMQMHSSYVVTDPKDTVLIEQNEDGGKRRNAAKKKELEATEKRIAELSAIFKRLYEDSVTGRISDERFTELSADYEAEQRELKERAAAIQAELSKAQEATVNAEKFMNVVRRHTSFEELTPTLLREFVEKIVVHECSYDENKTRRQDIEIYYSFVGKVDLPE